MKIKSHTYVIFLLVFFLASSCAPSVKKAYTKIIKPCTENDLTGKMLFFGPANNLGPGDVLRAQDNGGFGLSFRFKRLVEDDSERRDIIDVSTNGTCEGTSQLSKRLSGKVAAKDFVKKPEASATLNSARKITTTISNFSWETLEQTIYEEQVDKLQDGSRLHSTIVRGDTYVITRALKVEGLVVTYSFKNEVSAAAQADFRGLSSNLQGNWASNTTFELRVNSPFYIAGELRPYTETGLAASGNRFGNTISIDENASVNTDQEEISN